MEDTITMLSYVLAKCSVTHLSLYLLTVWYISMCSHYNISGVLLFHKLVLTDLFGSFLYLYFQLLFLCTNNNLFV